LNILIDTIRIAGFRGIKNLEMSLPRVTLLIGMNNSGKTSVLKALQLALGDYSRYLSEEDFYIGNDDKRADEIVVDVRIVPVDEQGDRIDTFDDDWLAEFGGGRIQSEANSRQYVALRTRSKPDEVKGGFDTSYSVLRKWTDYSNWLTERVEIAQSFSRLTSILFIPIDAQRAVTSEALLSLDAVTIVPPLLARSDCPQSVVRLEGSPYLMQPFALRLPRSPVTPTGGATPPLSHNAICTNARRESGRVRDLVQGPVTNTSSLRGNVRCLWGAKSFRTRHSHGGPRWH